MGRRTTYGFTSGRSGTFRSALILVLAAVAAAVVLGSCTIANEPPGSGGVRIPARPVSDARSTSMSPVISAWLAAEVAFEQAALTADPDQPDLAATTVDPQLAWSQSLLAQMQSSGEVSRGPVDHGHPQILAQQAGVATVRSCMYDAEVVESSVTGRPVPGEAGQVDFELFTSTMEQTDTGWKLSTQTVGVGSCHTS
jgi:hypothetical protein